jgi:hypothetical protein
VITASFSGKSSGNLAIKSDPAALDTEGATAFKRDYEERAEELAIEIEVEETLFSDEAAEDAATAKADAAADAKKLEADRRARSIMQGYTGNMCSECQNFTMVRNGTCEKCDTCGSTWGDERVQLRPDELGHLILHSKVAGSLQRNYEGYQQQFDEMTSLESAEDQADIFARNFLIPPYIAFSHKDDPSKLSTQTGAPISIAKQAIKISKRQELYKLRNFGRDQRSGSKE